MTSLPGGAANQAGMLYQHWWTVLRIVDVLEGRATSIRIEPYGSSWKGLDLVVEESDIVWAEQVKNVQSVTNWTIAKLNSKQILDTIKVQVSQGRSFQFITSTPARQLDDFANRARESENFDMFQGMLRDSLAAPFDRLTEAWNVTNEQAWLWLKRVYVKYYPTSPMRDFVNANLQRLYDKDSAIISSLLRNYCEDNHGRLTASKIRLYMESKGIQQVRVDDPNVIEQLNLTVVRHKDRVNSLTPTHGLVTGSDCGKVLNLLQSKDNQQVVVLDGPAGYGKSTVVADIAQKLEQEGWFVAIIKMDTVKNTVSTSIELGKASRIEGSPSLLLARVANGNPALLIFDQLDAVSTYSGRMSDNFDAVVESLRELKLTPNVKSLLVVRTADLKGDPRLAQLANENLRHTIGTLDVEDIRRYLEEWNMTVPESGITLDLLRIPLHLAVFTRLPESARQNSFHTLQELYTEYTEHIRRNLERRSSGFPWSQFIGILVDNMNENEMLSAPESILDCLDQLEVDAAISESIIMRSNGRVSFFHESYFDYLFARAFIGSGNDLLSFLVNTGQYLFQRAQTRQILEYLVASDRTKFRNVVVELLDSTEIRTHLKGVVVGVLAQINPEQEDWDVLEVIAWSDTPISPKILALLNRTGWFDAADANARWEQWLDDPSRAGSAFSALIAVAGERSERVKQLVKPYIGKSGDWEDRLRLLVMSLRSAESVDLAIEVIDNGYLDLLLSSKARDSYFWLQLYNIKDENPAAAARLIGAFLDRGFYCAQLDHSSDPFTSGHLSTHGYDGASIIKIAKSAPTEFIDYVLPFVVDVAYANQIHNDFKLPIGRRWGLYSQRGIYISDSADDVIHSIDEAVFLGVELALRKLVGEHLDKCDVILDRLQSAESKELRYLACRALAVCDSPDKALQWLLEDKRNMYLGQASQEIIESCSPGCSNDLFQRLEDTILGVWPNWELGGSSAGHTQYGLLSALSQSRMSKKAHKRLRELERKFPVSSEHSELPKRVATLVGSPISYEAVQHMSDENWLKALRKYNSTNLQWEGNRSIGGPSELAQQLGNCAAEKPERFARLALRFDEQIPAVAIENIIPNVGLKVDIDLFMDICNHAQNLYNEDVGRQICWTLRDLRAVNNDIVTILTEYSLDPDPNEEPSWMQNHQDSSIILYSMGMNSTRGAAALAISSILFQNEELDETYLENFQSIILRLVTDSTLAVRACAADGVRALLNHMPDQGLDIAEILFGRDLNVLADEVAMKLLFNVILRDPERFGDTLMHALNGSDQVAQQAGRVWAAASLHDTLPSQAVCDVSQLPLRAKCGAAEEFAENPVESGNYLEVLLNDEDPNVRNQAIRVVHCLDTLDSSDLNDITDMIVSSAAFDEHFGSLINKLAGLTVALPTATIYACRRAVELADSELADMRTIHAVTAHSLVTIILRLYRQSYSEERAKCLDLIDKLAELNIFGLAESLEKER